MRVMVIVKEDKRSEAGILPDEKFFAAMDKYNADLKKAGVLLSAEGLYPSSKGRRVKFADAGKRTVTDGPFTESKELIAGFWLWRVKSLDDATDWLKRAPFGPGAEIEIREVFEQEDFAAVRGGRRCPPPPPPPAPRRLGKSVLAIIATRRMS